MTTILRLILWFLLAIGFLGALNISYATFTNKNPCPNINGIYICFLVLLGYLLMIIAQIVNTTAKKSIFYIGWGITFLFAFSGTILEVINGQTCPKSNAGLPMCYVSLALTLVIVVLFFYLNRRITINQGQANG